MGKILKILLLTVGAVVALVVAALVTVLFVIDPNSYRDDIAAAVERATGRELVIEGDLSLSVFPWVAIEMGRTRLGNAEGFGPEPFASFERAKLSVRLLPLLLRREVSVGSAELDSLDLNLAVDAAGRSNWQDLAERGERGADEAAREQGEDALGRLDVASIDINNAAIDYANAQLNERYALSEVNLTTGSVTPGEPIALEGGFKFSAQPADLSGRIDIEAVVGFERDSAQITIDGLQIDGATEGESPFDFEFEAAEVLLRTDERIADLGRIVVKAFDLEVLADVAPFSYADSPLPQATLRVSAFSPRELAGKLDIELPPTADPNAFGRAMLDANAKFAENTVTLSDLVLVVDDTTLKGEVVVPRSSDGTYRIRLAGDSVNLSRYMEPVDESGTGARGGDVPVDIPVELIRAFNLRGNLTLERAELGRLVFTKFAAEINNSNGRLRLHPMSAQFLDGSYTGDVRIDASGRVPMLSVDERIDNVNLGALVKAMFERENVSGKINGRFTLTGRGANMAAVQQSLSGNLAFTLSDGAWEGTDVWYQIRRARALFKRETPPEPRLPPRTRFSEVTMTGQVTDGIVRSNDLRADMPFMQVTGRGSVNIPEATMDFALSARVLEKPELMQNLSELELREMTRANIPLRIRGPLAKPEIAVDIETLLRQRVEQEIRDRALDQLLRRDRGTTQPPAGDTQQQQQPPPRAEDVLKERLLNELLGGDKPPAEGEAEQPPPETPEEAAKRRLRELLDN